MSGRKGMKQYSEEIKEEVRRRIAAGEPQREISRETGISRYTIQSWCGLRPETKLRQLAPLPKGRPKEKKTIEDYEKENKRLRMEVALMRDFVQSTERK
jgi:transposase